MVAYLNLPALWAGSNSELRVAAPDPSVDPAVAAFDPPTLVRDPGPVTHDEPIAVHRGSIVVEIGKASHDELVDLFPAPGPASDGGLTSVHLQVSVVALDGQLVPMRLEAVVGEGGDNSWGVHAYSNHASWSRCADHPGTARLRLLPTPDYAVLPAGRVRVSYSARILAGDIECRNR